MRIARFLVPVLVAVAVLGASGCQSTAPSSKLVSEQDSGTTVTISPGQDLIVKLEANPSTGYSWAVESLPQFLAEKGEPTFESGASGNVVGAGGTQTTTFSTTAKGRGELKMNYARPWETTATPAKTFSVVVESK